MSLNSENLSQGDGIFPQHYDMNMILSEDEYDTSTHSIIDEEEIEEEYFPESDEDENGDENND